MSFDALKKSNTKFLFQLAGVFGIIYFVLRAEALRILIPFLDLIDIHAHESSLPWWLPVWPLDKTFLSQPAYGAGAPILAISFALALMALAGLLWNIKGKNLENNRSMVVAAIVSTTLLLVTSLIFIIYAFPDLETGRVNPIPEGSHLPLYILFVVTDILSITTFASLAFNLFKSRKLSIWAGIALVFGIVIVNINWFSVLSLSFDFIGNFYWLVMLFGLGWGLGLWQLSKAA